MSATVTKESADEMLVFQLEQGCFEDTAEGWERPVGEDGRPIMNHPDGQPLLTKSHMYRYNEPGNNVVRSKEDLVKKFGEKFSYLSGNPNMIDAKSVANRQLVSENEELRRKVREQTEMLASLQPKPEKFSTVSGLEGMTAKQLAEYCSDNEIEAKGCKTKDDYLAAIQLHKNAPTK